MPQNDSDSIESMKDMPRLKTIMVEPKIYALVIKTNRIAILHVGVYYALDEAVAAVKQRAMDETGLKDVSKLNMDLWMWEIMPISGALAKIFGKDFSTELAIAKDLSTVPQATVIPQMSATEKAKQVYDMKNELMKRIIDTKDVEAFEEAKTFLSKSEIRLIHAKITANEKIDDKAVQ